MKRYRSSDNVYAGGLFIVTPNDRVIGRNTQAVIRELNHLNDQLIKAKAKIEYLEEVRRDLAIRANGYHARCEILAERIQAA